jgi:hypothetical protein
VSLVQIQVAPQKPDIVTKWCSVFFYNQLVTVLVRAAKKQKSIPKLFHCSNEPQSEGKAHFNTTPQGYTQKSPAAGWLSG